MRKSSVFSALAVILLFVSAGFAQDTKSEFSVQGTIDLPQNQDNIDIPHHATDSGGLMLGYRYHLNPIFAIQGDYGYTRDTQQYFDPVFGETDIQANIHQLTAEAVITAPSHARVRPYGLAGIGGLFFRPTNSFLNQSIGISNQTGNGQTKAAFVYGGGVDLDLPHFMAFRAEYRGYFFKIPDFQIPGLASDNFTHLAQPSVGVVWRF
ncbi:MAG TPA: porin family protein [Candidatus Angelobacter sp.]|nr:porin family protein [Candidatus Angelobacter sp.]